MLRQYRQARRLTQAELGERSAVSAHTVSALERGRESPRQETVGMLADALKLSPEERAALETAATDGAGGRRRGENLPHALTAFVGREAEVDTVRRLVEEHRLVTLTGTGGVGKTRLAVEVARGLTEAAIGAKSPTDGVWLAELGPLADPDLVPRAVAAAVGAAPDSARPSVAAMADALRPRRLLLVLDNCEHLVETCADLAETLLRECPGVRLLATSRELLGCAGEAVFRVPSLGVPPDGGAPSLGGLLRSDAARLFIERAATSAPGFALTARNAPAVAEICRRLDGIPLALELAAARVRGLPVEEVASRLDDRFQLLAGGRRTAIGRQQTLRALVDWSYDLLSPVEQVLFARLSVFAGSFTLAAAEAVCGEPADPRGVPGTAERSSVLDSLLRLVDTSLVLTEPDASIADEPVVARYRLLETLRAYGRERLLAWPSAERVWRRHLEYCLDQVEDLVARAAAAPPEASQAQWLQWRAAERENLWAALRWAHDQADPEAADRLSGVVARVVARLAAPAAWHAATPLVFELRRLGLPAYAEVERRLLEQADPAVLTGGADLYHLIGDHAAEATVVHRLLEAARDRWGEPAVARVQVRYARLRVLQNAAAESLTLLEEVARTAVAHGDDELLLDVRLEQGRAYGHLADCSREGEAYARALALLERLRPTLPEETYQVKRLAALRGSGNTAHNADDNATCVAHHAAALTIARQVRDGPAEAIEGVNLADGQWGCGDYGTALQTYRRALEVSTASCYTLARALAQLGQGIVLWSAGRYPDAARSLDDGLVVARDLGDAWWIAYGLTYRGNVYAGCGDLVAARRLSREALTRARASGVGYPLYLAWMHALWQDEVVAPGAAAHAPQIEEALRETRRLGLRGLAVYLAWVHLLHRVADPSVPDGTLEQELMAGVRAYQAHAPLKGTWEQLGLQAVHALRARRPTIDRTKLEALIEDVIRQKEESLPVDERPAYRDSRRCWEAGW